MPGRTPRPCRLAAFDVPRGHVRAFRGSPLMRLQMLRRPRWREGLAPFESRLVSAAASSGLLVRPAPPSGPARTIWKAGIPSSLPCRNSRPGSLDVIEGRIASQRESLSAAVTDPRRHGVHGSRADPAREDRMGEAVDLDDHDARLVGLRGGSTPPEASRPGVRSTTRRCRRWRRSPSLPW